MSNLMNSVEQNCDSADAPCSAIEVILSPRVADLGGFSVRRLLPTAKRKMVGPWIFFDEMGPAAFPAGEGIKVLPHPHIGIATVTYLIEGNIMHRDSEGYVQAIRPGEVNMMTAGRGIVHSVRAGPDFRANGGTVYGFQAWLALPKDMEESDPGFQHIGAGEVPTDEGDGVRMSLLAGTLNGRRSPTELFSDTLYADLVLEDGARYKVDSLHIERAMYVAEGSLEIVGQDGFFGKDQLVVFQPDAEIVIKAHGASRLMLLGGEPFPEKRHIFWNFVSSSRERIEQAAQDWKERRFPGILGENEFIPLPDEREF